MTAVAMLLLAASLGYGLARWLNLPAIPFLILGGFVLTLTGQMEGEFMQEALLLGITFLVFVAGVELNPERVRHQKGAALIVGAVQFVLLGGVGYLAARGLGFEVQTATYLALALTASSTLVAVRILQQRGQLFEPFGRLVIGVLLLQDLLVILLIPVLSGLPQGTAEVVRGVSSTLFLMGLAWILLRWVLPAVLRKLSLDEELLLLVVLSLLFAFMFLSDRMGVPLVAGAFVAGVALSSFPVSGVVRGQLASVSDFFTAVFFTALGATLGIPSPTELLQAAVLALVVLVLTPPVVAWIAERAGFSARPAIFSGLLLSQTSEFSLVVGVQGVVLGHLAPGAFNVIVLVTLGTMMLTPLLAGDRVSLWLMHLHPSRRIQEADDPPRDHVLLLGCGTSGMPLLETLMIGPHRLVAVDDDPQVVALVREAGIQAFRGDAADERLLFRTGAHQARVVISTVRRVQDNEQLLEVARGRTVLVRAFNDQDAAWVKARGGRAVLYADAAAHGFLEWFDRGGWQRGDDLEEEEMEEVL